MAEIMQPEPAAVGTALRRWRWGPPATVIAISSGLIVIIFAIFGVLCVQGFDSTLQGARSKAQAAADLVADEAGWMLGSAHTLLKHIASTASVPADLSDEEAALDTALKSMPAPASLALYDATGAAWGTAISPDAPASIADSDVFDALEAGGDWGISRQMAGAGGPVFLLAQRLGTDSFGGVAALVISGSMFEKLWAPLNLGPYSATSLVRADGWVIGRYPALPDAIDIGDSQPFTGDAKSGSGSYLSPKSPVDGVARVVGFRRLPELGIVAISAVSRDAAFAALWTAISTVLWLMVPIALALLGGSLLTARLLRQSERTQAKLAAAVAHNDVLFREIHHRVKNNLQSVGALLQMQPIPREIKADMSQRIAAMSAVHEHIYRSNNFAVVRVNDYVQTLIDNIRAAHEPNVTVVEKLAELSVDKDAATPLGLILNEVVSNAFKHAFPEGQPGTISVQLARVGDHGELVVEDNGRGYDPAAPAKGIGHRLITALTQQLGGEAHSVSTIGNGSRFTLTFPLAK